LDLLRRLLLQAALRRCVLVARSRLCRE
jgi:hypothetical protein